MTSTTVAELAAELNKPTTVLLDQLAGAMAQLAREGEARHDGIHQARKSLRRARAALALARRALGDEGRRIDAALTAACRGMGALRDADPSDLDAYWRDLPALEREDAQVVRAMCEALIADGQHTQARKLIEAYKVKTPGPDAAIRGLSGDFHTTTLNGRQQVSNVRWNEVGSINLQARLNNDSYLATPDVAAKPDSADIGRFYPHHFELVSSEVTNSCNNIFSYMSQPALTINYQLAAKGEAGNTLFNYHSTDYSGTAVATVVAEQNAVRLAADRFSVVAGSWQRGVYNVEQTDASFNRAALRDGPYTALQLGIKLLLERDGRNFQSYTLGTDAAALDGGLTIRFGRLVLDNTYGPEQESLPVRLQAQYWYSPIQRFIHNSEDNCTLLSAGAVVQPDSNDPNLQLQKEQPYVGSATETLQASSNPQAAFTAMQQGSSVINGVPALLLPAAGVRGRGNMEYLAPTWLQYNWSGKVSGCTANPDDPISPNCFDENPTAEFMFGRFRGNPRQIFWRERFQ